jgi:type II secretory pathway pseudopilin PulG
MKDKRGFSFVTIMIILAVSSLLLRFVIAQIIEVNITQNESNAQEVLKLISAALENYAREHLGNFPANLSVLTQDNPPYIDRDYIRRSPIKGYYYNCGRLEAFGYSCSALPVKCGLTGKMIFSVSSGDSIVSEECSKKR